MSEEQPKKTPWGAILIFLIFWSLYKFKKVPEIGFFDLLQILHIVIVLWAWAKATMTKSYWDAWQYILYFISPTILFFMFRADRAIDDTFLNVHVLWWFVSFLASVPIFALAIMMYHDKKRRELDPDCITGMQLLLGYVLFRAVISFSSIVGFILVCLIFLYQKYPF